MPIHQALRSAGITLQSVSVDLPGTDRSFPPGAGVDTADIPAIVGYLTSIKGAK